MHARTHATTHSRLASMHASKLLVDDTEEHQATDEGDGQIIKFGLDPLIQTLVNYRNQDEITSKLTAIFKRLDSGIWGCCYLKHDGVQGVTSVSLPIVSN